MPNDASHPSTTTTKMRELLVRSVREVERLRAELAAHETRAREPIAILGVGLRAPGGIHDLDQLWARLAASEDLVREVPPERWDPHACYDPEPGVPGRTYVNHAAFLDAVAEFDPAFFGISPREARSLDPQHRLLLEATWEALERARIVPAELATTRTGVYVGAGPSEYARLQSADAGDTYAVMGTHPSFAAGRVAFHLGLHGPALTLDTACSSSLVALHLARAALLADECELAIAAGVQVMAGPEGFVHLSSTRTVAPDGRCKTFSAAADGYGRGEGVVVLALARQSRAEASGYPILGLIRGSAVNHDGASNGITAPSGGAQQRVIRAALADAELEPASVDLVECHGTGTQLGDPIEVQALGAVYGRARSPEQPALMIGTVKTNLGHLESAAGLAGVAKVLTAFSREAVAPSLRSSPPNPLIAWDELGVEVVDQLQPWPRDPAARVRRAGVSAFGLSGTNAHVILEEAPEPSQARPEPGQRPTHVPVLVSGRSEAAMQAQARALADHLRADTEPDRDGVLVDLAAAAATTRQHFEHRASIVAKLDEGGQGLLAKLDALAEGGHATPSATSAQLEVRVAKQGWMFSGQGAQAPGMAGALYRAYPAFRASFDACCEGFGERIAADLRNHVLGEPSPEARAALDQTGLTQPALFAYELSLARLLESWGMRPALVLGHSIGELVAAQFAGLWSLADACTLVATRAQLMQDLSLDVPGAMLAIEAPSDDVEPLLADHPGVEIAGLNGPQATVVSGDAPAIEALHAALETAGQRSRMLRVSHAFHSHHMDAIVEAFEAVAATLEYRTPTLPLISTQSGELATFEQLSAPRYWARQMREAVRFGPAIATAEARGVGIFVELGPHPVLAPMAHACLSEASRDHARFVALAHRRRDPLRACLRGLGQLHCAGVEIDWQAMFAEHRARPVALPTYAFVRQHYWTQTQTDATAPAQGSRAPTGDYALAGESIELSSGARVHRLDVGPRLQPYLGDHTVYGTLVVPGSFYLALLLALGHSCWPEAGLELRRVEFIRALSFTGPHDQVTLHVEVQAPDPSAPVDLREAIVFSVLAGERREHARGLVGPLAGRARDQALADHPGPAPTTEAYDRSALERALETVEIEWGPRWWWLDEAARVNADTAQGLLRPPPGEAGDDAPIACGFIDNSFGLQAWARADERASESTTAQLPFSVERLVWFGVRDAPPRRAELRCERVEADSTTSTLRYWDAAGQPLARLEGFTTHRAPRARLLEAVAGQHLYRIAWRPLDQESTSEASAATATAVELGLDHPSLTRWLERRQDQALPEHLVFHVEGSGPAESQRVCAEVLASLQRWLAEPELTVGGALTLVTRGALSVAGEPPEDLAAATGWGLVRAAAAEHPQLDLRLLDLDPALARAAQADALARALSLTKREPELALRGGRVLRPRLVPARSRPGAPVPPIDWGRGAVLITGASGLLGRHLARELVEARGARELVLVSRRGLDDPAMAELAATLEAGGARAHVRACDLGQPEARTELFETLDTERPLRGLIHCAGVLDDAPVTELDPGRLATVFTAKLDAAHHLDTLTRGLELDAFVLCSSASASFGAAGQANYAAANAGLDALASARRAAGYPGLAIAWGPWAGGGMAAKLDPGALRRRGVRALEPASGLALFSLALALDHPQLVAIELDRPRIRALDQAGQRVSPMLAELLGPRRAHLRPTPEAPQTERIRLARLTGAARREAVVERIAREIGALLELDPATLELERDLRDYGLDSLMALELRNGLQQLLGLALPSTVVLDHPSCAALTELVLDHLPSAPAAEPDGPSTAKDKTRVRDFLVLQDQAARARASDPAAEPRASLGLLELFQRFIDDDFEPGLARLREVLMVLRAQTDQHAKPALPAPVALLEPGADQPPAQACVYAIPALGFPSSPLQFVQIAAACRAIAGTKVALWSSANPGIEARVALPTTLASVIDYHLAAYDQIHARTGLRPILKGFSSGGWLATRVAARLEARGQPAPGLVLLDSSHPFETDSTPIEGMFISNAIDHHLETGGDDEYFIHELTGMLRLMALAFEEWTEVRVDATPTLHITSETGFDFPRWNLKFVADPMRHWGPYIRDLSAVSSPIEHYAMLTEGAHEAASHTCRFALARGS